MTIKKFIIFRLSIVFILYALFVAFNIAYNFQKLIKINIQEKSLAIQESIKAGLTAHMKNNTMDRIDYFFNEIKNLKGVRRIWVVRTDDIGLGEKKTIEKDAIEQEVLTTRKPQLIPFTLQEGEKYRVAAPYIATNQGNLKCLDCHHVKEGTVLGILNMEMDVDSFTESNYKILASTLIIFVIFALLSIIILVASLNKAVARPLRKLIDHFAISIKEYKPIDAEEFPLAEFTAITRQMNSIIEEIKERDEDIQRMNMFLEQKVAERTRELEHRAITDDLTGLCNRMKLDDDLQRFNDVAKAVLIVNIDDFSQINNVYGMRVGDKVLIEVARLIRRMSPPNAFCYRVSADEFIVMVPDPGDNEEVELAKSLREYTNHSQVTLPDERLDIKLTLTIGMDKAVEDTVVRHASIAFIEAREMGKNRYHIYNPNSLVEQRYASNIHYANILKKAIETDNIIPYFQPIINNRTGKVEKFECLVRMIDCTGEIIPPGRFLDPAKRTGIATTITKIVIDKSFRYFKDHPYEFSINLTDSDFKEGFLVKHLLDLASRYDIAHSRVVLEILESLSIQGSRETIAQINELSSYGFQIAIDDFGADYSNFSRLLELHADYIKIDGSFIKNVDKDPNSYKITKSITEFARSVNAKVVAEFVHCKEVQEKVLDLRIEFSQGYYFSPPKSNIDGIVKQFG